MQRHTILMLLAAWPFVACAESTTPERLNLSPEVRQRCVDVLRAGFHANQSTNDFWPSMHAAEALTLAGRGDEVRAELEGRVGNEPDDQHRCGLAREMVRAGDKSKVAVLLDVLAKADTYGHTHAAESLFKVGEIGDGKLLRRAMTQTDDVKRRLMAAAALAKRGDAEALVLIRKYLPSSDAEAHRLSCGLRAEIREYLPSSDAEARKIAAWILSWIGDKSDIPQLKHNLSVEKDPVNHSFIVNSLANLGDASARKALGRNLDSPDFAIRTYAAELTGHSHSVAFADKLVKLLDDPVLDVRVRAAQSLVALTVQSRNPALLRQHVADYDSALHGKDGRVDVDALVKRLKELGVTAYYWLIWQKATDWDDLKLFLPKAAEAGIEVWPYLVPPTESAPRYGDHYAEPFRLDYLRWAEEIARLSLQHTNLTAWVIDDFYANHEFFTPTYVHGMQARAKLVNPRLAFLPLMYFGELQDRFVHDYRNVIDGAVVAYLQDRDEIERTWALFNDAAVTSPSELSYPYGVQSHPGDFVMASQSAKVQPAERYRLSFAERDDFTGATAGYHFKQLLVDDAVVWEEDVAGGPPIAKKIEVDVTEQARGKKNVAIAFRLLDKKGVSNFGVHWRVSDLRAEGLRVAADLREPQKWKVIRQGAFEAGFGAKPQVGQRRFHIPFVSMTAAVAYEFRMRHGDPATPERIAEWLRLSLQTWRDSKCDGVVTYCLEKQPNSQTFPLAQKLFHEFKKDKK